LTIAASPHRQVSSKTSKPAPKPPFGFSLLGVERTIGLADTAIVW
jgi:hypothetical protein